MPKRTVARFRERLAEAGAAALPPTLTRTAETQQVSLRVLVILVVFFAMVGAVGASVWLVHRYTAPASVPTGPMPFAQQRSTVRAEGGVLRRP